MSTRAEQQALLDARARGIRTHNLALFLSGDDPTQPEFIRRDRRYFKAVSALPWATYRLTATSTPWPQPLLDPAWGEAVVLPQVSLETQLAGFDDTAQQRTTGFAFVTRKGRTYIASDRTVHGHLFPGYRPDPWDLGTVTVRRSAHALGIFDPVSASKAGAVMSLLRRSIRDVSADVPYSWNEGVVLYASGAKNFASALVAGSGGDVDHLGALTYSLDPADPIGAARIVVLREALRGSAPALARTIRHEVAHLALSSRSPHIPLWLAEGVAEYQGARAVRANARQLPDSALRRAGLTPTGMPSDATFHDADQTWHYALSWMAVESIVRQGGPPLLWALVDALDNGGIGTARADQDSILEQILGMNGAQLSVQAVSLIRRTYG